MEMKKIFMKRDTKRNRIEKNNRVFENDSSKSPLAKKKTNKTEKISKDFPIQSYNIQNGKG